MTSLGAAYDNIRLLRRKIAIAQGELDQLVVGPARDLVLIELRGLTNDLIRALNDFAELGFENHVAQLISHTNPVSRRAQPH